MAVLLVISALFVGKTVGRYVASDKVNQKIMGQTVVIDAGHGGNDPGKIGVNQCKEKEINLKIAEKVRKRLEEAGVTVKMTRTSDAVADTADVGNHKIEDMKERVRLINETKPALAVSIHQNSYTGESIRGAQVFYFTHSQSGKSAAEIMQERLRKFDPDNKREAKANNTYYMLKKTEPATIIVECGFLSNWEEAEKLVTDDYQEKIAEVICGGIFEILEKQGEDTGKM